MPLDLLWSDRRGELDVLVVMVRSPTTPDLAVAVVAPPFDVPFIYVPACREILDQAERRQLEPLRGKFDLVVCWHSTCRFSTLSSGDLGCPLISVYQSFIMASIGAAPI